MYVETVIFLLSKKIKVQCITNNKQQAEQSNIAKQYSKEDDK